MRVLLCSKCTCATSISPEDFESHQAMMLYLHDTFMRLAFILLHSARSVGQYVRTIQNCNKAEHHLGKQSFFLFCAQPFVLDVLLLCGEGKSARGLFCFFLLYPLFFLGWRRQEILVYVFVYLASPRVTSRRWGDDTPNSARM